MIQLFKNSINKKLINNAEDNLLILSESSPVLHFYSKKTYPVESRCWYHLPNKPLTSWNQEWWREKLAITNESDFIDSYNYFNRLVESQHIPEMDFELSFKIEGIVIQVFDEIVITNHIFETDGEYSYQCGRGYVWNYLERKEIPDTYETHEMLQAYFGFKSKSFRKRFIRKWNKHQGE